MKFKIIVFMSLAAILFACQSDSDELVVENPSSNNEQEEELPAFILRQDIELTAVEHQLAGQNNTFAFNLLKTVYASQKDDNQNILLSPLSATLAFSMLNNGAAGTTGEEVRQTLGFGNVSNEIINNYAHKVVSVMQILDPRAVFESANSIWIQTDFPVFNAFKQVNKQYYNAEIQNVDFSEPATVKLINNWANDKTHGKIPEILKEIDPSTVLMLGNALYFKGYWMEPFMKEYTTDAAFRTSNGSEQMVPMMRKSSRISHYAKLENCAALELPFGNSAFSLVVVLPDEDTDISAVVDQMDGDWWAQVIMGLESPPYNLEVRMEIPRFKLAYERTLNNDLMAMGMQTPFAKAADFSLISQVPLFVSQVLQKTFVQMNEDGMEAAAVTIIQMAGDSGIQFIPVDFKVNRPFLYFLKEKSTGLVFFVGVMNQIT